ncbi:hypothetical protein P4310_24745 [Bacillus thuringiensis]|uniref:hypothetical protein n=1 Tax=Bacillus thuringiensis TaxID=1428 RepID=UPI00159402B7|nr:hypothetical protein [Bacillus thuringiensis]MED3068670.1 hypothetical protein [Bacillus thuringiensis]
MSYIDIPYAIIIILGLAGIVTGIRSMFIELKEIRDIDKQKTIVKKYEQEGK